MCVNLRSHVLRPRGLTSLQSYKRDEGRKKQGKGGTETGVMNEGQK